MALLGAMNFSGEMLQGMEVMIYMLFFFFFEKLHMRKSSTRDIPFTNLAKTKNAVSRIKAYLQCEELSPDNQTGRGRFPLIFFPVFYYYFFFLRGKIPFPFSFAD